jgi:hypothetical protein
MQYKIIYEATFSIAVVRPSDFGSIQAEIRLVAFLSANLLVRNGIKGGVSIEIKRICLAMDNCLYAFLAQRNALFGLAFRKWDTACRFVKGRSDPNMRR